MTQVATRKARVESWLSTEAMELWTGTGVDRDTGTVWEALDHAGAPCSAMTRRLRVQVRQAYCFAMSDEPEHRALAHRLFRFSMDHGFERGTGNLAAQLSPDVQIMSAPHDLYDLAFMLLAASALIEAGFEIEADLARLEAELQRLKAPRGWYENIARDLPRRQNPHMHLFEAATALYRATGAARFKAMAEECLGLFIEVFLQPDGQVLEYFDANWRPLDAEKPVSEPGHMAEWVYLLDCYEVVCGRSSGVPLETLFAAVVNLRDDFGLLPDRSDPSIKTRRMWPQTELLKASLVMRKRGERTGAAVDPDTVLDTMWREYLDTPVSGGWYDKRSSCGKLLSDNMPASTFYHIAVAIRFYLADGVQV